jgi:hypothetical protein
LKAFQAYFVTSRAGMPSLCTSRRQPRTSRRVENIMASPPLKLSYSPLLPGHSRLKITPQGGRTPRSLSRAGLFDDQDLLATQTHFVGPQGEAQHSPGSPPSPLHHLVLKPVHLPDDWELESSDPGEATFASDSNFSVAHYVQMEHRSPRLVIGKGVFRLATV